MRVVLSVGSLHLITLCRIKWEVVWGIRSPRSLPFRQGHGGLFFRELRVVFFLNNNCRVSRSLAAYSTSSGGGVSGVPRVLRLFVRTNVALRRGLPRTSRSLHRVQVSGLAIVHVRSVMDTSLLIGSGKRQPVLVLVPGKGLRLVTMPRLGEATVGPVPIVWVVYDLDFFHPVAILPSLDRTLSCYPVRGFSRLTLLRLLLHLVTRNLMRTTTTYQGLLANEFSYFRKEFLRSLRGASFHPTKAFLVSRGPSFLSQSSIFCGCFLVVGPGGAFI